MLYKLGKDGTETFIGVTGLTPKYSQSMICDPITGKLYWAFINDQESALYEINTLTGTAYKIDDMPHFEEIVGMFIEAPAFSDKVPEAVTDLKFTPSLEGSLNGIVSCVAPTENKKGENLSGTVKVTIYSGMEKILEQDVTPGTTVRKNNYTFDANKLYTLYAVASNSEGESPKQSITIYVGKDVASAPSNVTFKKSRLHLLGLPRVSDCRMVILIRHKSLIKLYVIWEMMKVRLSLQQRLVLRLVRI